MLSQFSLVDPAVSQVYFDLSWDKIAKYIVATPASTRITGDLLNKFPDRFLFGTDEVAPANQSDYIRVLKRYDPLWKMLTTETSEKVRKTITSGCSAKRDGIQNRKPEVSLASALMFPPDAPKE